MQSASDHIYFMALILHGVDHLSGSKEPVSNPPGPELREVALTLENVALRHQLQGLSREAGRTTH
jgi:hypothetical protein